MTNPNPYKEKNTLNTRKQHVKTSLEQAQKKIERKSYAQQGWECPKCGSMYAIWVSECPKCSNSKYRVVTYDRIWSEK